MKISILLALALIVSACGGGGSGTTTATTATTTTTTTTSTVLSFQPLVGGGTSAAIVDIFSKDLTGDGIDEVIVIGRKSQTASDDNWQNFNVRIYGWNNSTTLADETSTWLPGGINIIVGSEPSIQFGDFDGDGDVDMFFAASTDMYDVDGPDNIANNTDDQSLRGDSIVFVNNGARVFSKTTVESNATWSHDSVAHDFTGDGNPDIMVTDYQQNPRIFYYDTGTSTWKKLTSTTNWGASGIAVGQYVAGGNKEIVATDNGVGGSSNDRHLWSYAVDLGAGTFTITQVGDQNTLPNDDNANYGHTIRALTMDFDGDGDDDIIAFERKLSSNVSGRIQFMRNNGNTTFTDVSGSMLTGYNGNNGSVGYQAVILDANGDGKNDIFISGQDSDGTVDQTTILMNNGANSLYTASYTSNFAAVWSTNNTAVTADYYTPNSGENQHIVLGPSNNYYLLTLVQYQDNSNVTYKLFTKNLSTTISTGL